MVDYKALRLTPLYVNRVLTKETIGRRIENVYVSLARSEVVVSGDMSTLNKSPPHLFGRMVKLANTLDLKSNEGNLLPSSSLGTPTIFIK